MELSALSSGNYRQWLAEELNRLKAINRSYSLRSFARKLGVSPASLSQVMSGKRPLTRKAAETISERLGLSPTQRRALLRAVGLSQSYSQFPEIQNSRELEEKLQEQLDRFRVHSEWQHRAIFHLLQINEALTARKIAQRLGLPISQTQDALERLSRVHLASREGRTWKFSGKPLTESQENHRSANKVMQRQLLDKALAALDEVGSNESIFAADFLSVPNEKIAEFKQEISDLTTRLKGSSASREQGRLFTMAVQLFPVERNF